MSEQEDVDLVIERVINAQSSFLNEVIADLVQKGESAKNISIDRVENEYILSLNGKQIFKTGLTFLEEDGTVKASVTSEWLTGRP